MNFSRDDERRSDCRGKRNKFGVLETLVCVNTNDLREWDSVCEIAYKGGVAGGRQEEPTRAQNVINPLSNRTGDKRKKRGKKMLDDPSCV